MPDNNRSELLMSLSADIMLQMLRNPTLDPTFPNLPDIAFSHAARLINTNLNFQKQATDHVEQKAKPRH